jgi:hypothetical protein
MMIPRVWRWSLIVLVIVVCCTLIDVVFIHQSFGNRYSVTDGNMLSQLITSSIQDSNPSICGNLYAASRSLLGRTTTDIQGMCYMQYIIAHPAVDICPSNESDCITYFAIKEKRPADCLRITDASPKLDCVTRTAGQYGDSHICTLLSGDDITYCLAHYTDY